MLLVCGEKELVAFDAADGGKAAWRRPHPPASGFWSAVAAGDQRVAAAYPNGLLSILDSASGNELWSRMIEGGKWYGVPAVDGGFVVVMAQVPPKLFIFDLETGAERNATGIPDGLIVEPRAAGGRVYYADKNNMLHALDGATGKLLWKHPCGGVVTQLYAARHLVVAVLDRKKVIAVDPHGEGVRKPWSPLLPADASVIGVRADGEDLYVSYVQQNKACVDAYSIPAQGKRLWTADVSSEPGSLDLAPDYLASEHLALTMSNFDPLGAKAAVVVLADRKTGKLVWDTALSSEGRNIPNDNGVPPYSVRLFDGGVVVTENLKRTAYAAAGAGAGKADIQDLKTKLAAAPEDAALCIKLACAQYEQGEGSEALGTLSAALAAGGLADDKFTAVCGTLARLRKDFAQKNKFVFEFRKTEQAPALDGTTASWAAFPETVLEGWRNVYLASEEDPAPGVQKALWKGAGDLKAAFRGAYDDKHLYLMWVVTDDRQVNEQVSGNHCDLGDSVKVVFDIDRDGGRGYRGKDFELGLALGKEGKTLFHRWVENGRYIGANPPLDAAAKAVRNEADRQTVYQLALPLAHLGLTAEAGRRFGFSFAVNDQDDGSSVEKSMAASPGVIKPPYPGLFAEGVLQGK